MTGKKKKKTTQKENYKFLWVHVPVSNRQERSRKIHKVITKAKSWEVGLEGVVKETCSFTFLTRIFHVFLLNSNYSYFWLRGHGLWEWKEASPVSLMSQEEGEKCWSLPRGGCYQEVTRGEE